MAFIGYTQNYVYMRYTSSLYRINRTSNDMEYIGSSAAYGNIDSSDAGKIQHQNYLMAQLGNHLIKIDSTTDNMTIYNIGIYTYPIQIDPSNPNIIRMNSSIYNITTNMVYSYNGGFEYYSSPTGGVHTTHGSYYQGGVYSMMYQDLNGYYYKVSSFSPDLILHGNNTSDVYSTQGGLIYYLEP